MLLRRLAGHGTEEDMLKLYYAPRTRSVRIRWLLEELGIPHELELVEFRPQPSVFAAFRGAS